jgi:hypothetical protein
MARFINDAIADAIQAAQGRFGIFFRVAAPEGEAPLCLWSGVQSRFFVEQSHLLEQWTVNEAGEFVGPDGALGGDTYIGLGTLLEAPEIDHIVDATAAEVRFSLSMLASALADYLKADPPKVRGRRVQLGLVAFNEDWQPTMPVFWIGQYTASHLEDGIDPPPNETGPHTATLRLIANNGDTSRAKGMAVFWSPQQWGRQHPGNTFVDQVPRYQAGVSPAWPQFSATG